MSWPWNRGQRSPKVIGTDTVRSVTHDFLLTFHSNHGPISYRFQDKRWFHSKFANFSHPVYLTPQPKGFPLELGIGTWRQKTRMTGYRAEEEVWGIEDVFSHLDTINERDIPTDRQTDTGQQQRPRLRIAWRGNMGSGAGMYLLETMRTSTNWSSIIEAYIWRPYIWGLL